MKLISELRGTCTSCTVFQRYGHFKADDGKFSRPTLIKRLRTGWTFSNFCQKLKSWQQLLIGEDSVILACVVMISVRNRQTADGGHANRSSALCIAITRCNNNNNNNGHYRHYGHFVLRRHSHNVYLGNVFGNFCCVAKFWNWVQWLVYNVCGFLFACILFCVYCSLSVCFF